MFNLLTKEVQHTNGKAVEGDEMVVMKQFFFVARRLGSYNRFVSKIQ